MNFKNKRVVISGASRGIGLAIAKKLAAEGANVAILAKTTEENPLIPGTIHTAAKEIEDLGSVALPIATDIRWESQVHNAIEKVVEEFGGIDILVNSAGCVALLSSTQIAMKRFDLMYEVNVRGTFMLSVECARHLVKSDNPHILNICPPLDMKAKWFSATLPYSLSKFGMSQCVLGMSAEFREHNIAVNGLWPHSLVATAAIANVVGGKQALPHCRTPAIMADAAAYILAKDSKECSGNFYIDDVALVEENKEVDLSIYRMDPEKDLWSDFFIPDNTPSVEDMIFPKFIE